MLLAYWLVGLGLIALLLLLLSATTHLCLRRRSIVAVSERLKQTDRKNELRWITERREGLIMATAMLRTAASLGLLLIIVDLCEEYGLTFAVRNVAALVLAFILVMIFGVAIPSSVAKYAAGSVITTSLPALRLLHVLSLPLLRSLEVIDGVVRRLAGVPPRSRISDADDVEREILDVVSEGELQGAVDEQEKEMIESVIQFGDIDVGNIMTPRTDIVAMEKNVTLKEAIDLIGKEGHSRIPVYGDTIDDILGVLYAKDLLPIAGNEGFDITKILRAVPYIPDSKPVDELLQEFKDRKVHMAIVLDEYGGTSGLVTIEDILEELVGEIIDEYEEPEADLLKRIDEHTVEVDARMRVDELNHELDLSLPEADDYETIGGFVFNSMGRIPRIGEQCEHDNVRIRVIAAEPRKINRLRLEIVPRTQNDRNGNNR